MAESLRDLQGWQVITTDEHGNITTGSRRRSRKSESVENVYIQRITDGLSFGRGDTVVMHDDATHTYSVYLIHEIRQNTLNNVIEIWAFSYLRWFELKAKKYYAQFNPDKLKDNLSEQECRDILFQEIDHNEIYLTAELSEIWLKDFISLGNIMDKADADKRGDKMKQDVDFWVRYICEPEAENFVNINIYKEKKLIQVMEPKMSEEHLKKMTVPMLKGYQKRLSTPKTSNLITREIRIDSSSPQRGQPSDDTKKHSQSTKKIKAEKSDEEEILHNQVISREKSVDEQDNDAPSNEESNDDNSEEEPKSTNVDDENNESSSHSSEEEDSDVSTDDVYNSRRKRRAIQRRAAIVQENKKRRTQNALSDEESEDIGIETESEEDLPLSSRRSSSTSIPTNTSTQGRKSPTEAIPSQPSEKKMVSIDKESLEKLMSKYKKLREKLKNRPGETKMTSSSTPSSVLPKSSSSSSSLFSSAFIHGRFDDEFSLDVAGLESKLRAVPDEKVNTIFSQLKSKKNLNDDMSIIQIIEDFVTLPARSKEFARYYMEVFDSLRKFDSKALYVNGSSGCGKTVITDNILNELEKSSIYKELPIFKLIKLDKKTINVDYYKYLWNEINFDKENEDGIELSSGASERSLEYFFTSVPKNRKRSTVVVVDDLDYLVGDDSNLLYNLFHWTTFPNSKLVVITIGQNPDLIKQTLGKHLLKNINYQNISFDNYSNDELYNIVKYRLKTLENTCKFKVQKRKRSREIFFERIDNADNIDEILAEIKDKDYLRVVTVKIDDDIIEDACKKICSMSNNAVSAILAINTALKCSMEEYINIQGTILRRNLGLTVSNLPEYQSLSLTTILRALGRKKDTLAVDVINKLSDIEKLFLYGCLLVSRQRESLQIETKDVSERMAKLVNDNINNKFIKTIIFCLANDSLNINNVQTTTSRKKKKFTKELFDILNWNKIICDMALHQFIDIVEQGSANGGQMPARIQLKITLQDLSDGLDIRLTE